MDHREYSQNLVWQKLIRDEKFIEWRQTKNPELRQEIEYKYRAFDLRFEDSDRVPFASVYINPSFIRTLTPVYESQDPDNPRKIKHYVYGPRQPLSTKIAFEIDLEKFKWRMDRAALVDQIKEEIDSELRLREKFNDTETRLHYRPYDFDRDCALLLARERSPSISFKTLAYRHGYNTDGAARKAFLRIYELIYDKPYQETVSPDESSIRPCQDCSERHNCPYEKSEECPSLKKLLDPLHITLKERLPQELGRSDVTEIEPYRNENGKRTRSAKDQQKWIDDNVR